ncbi:helix-turn-helix domain-containing protein [Vibrio mangrovi]|uniref:Helix-turn-helix domain-containing protein n=1 Tax=Vibrio mangrovi TaxID=474394 RepID=A0ABU4I838_9VIBR|nr:helix-turn-helix domain-containing protein [Vibrio mangrovi]MDW6004114.1 helix-turn-helix domain-containing protein [Vibrio mangrovi]
MSRRFHTETGMTLVRWRQLVRLMRALEWLQEAKAGGWVAQSCGYHSTSAFIAVFQQYLGCSPGRVLIT